MNDLFKKIIKINNQREVLEPLFASACVASVKDTFNIITAIATLTEKKDLASFLLPNLSSVIKKEETRRLVSSMEAIKSNRNDGDENAISDFLLIAVNRFDIFINTNQAALLIAGDEEWNAMVLKTQQASSAEEIMDMGGI